MTLSTSAASKKWKKIHKAAMTVYIDALWIFFYRLFMFDAFVLTKTHWILSNIFFQ